MDYFYAPPEKISRDSVEIVGEEFAHLVHVMRKKEGDVIRVVDGQGTAYSVTLTSIRKKTAAGKIDSRYSSHNESERAVTLAVGILKNPSKFDFLVEKATELGVKKFVPLTTQRTIPHHAKSDRWQKLALAAMKQCGRSYLPDVEELQEFSSVLETVRAYDLSIVCHESAKEVSTMSDVLHKKPASILILIGPEGGFAEEEFSSCVRAGCAAVSLGPRRLRTETAAITAAALVLRE